MIANHWLDEEQALHRGLLAAGWSPSDVPAEWTCSTGDGDLVLRELTPRPGWRRFQLAGTAVPQTSPARLLFDNFHLSGPRKLVQRDGGICCRADVPWDAASPGSTDWTLAARPAWDDWARSMMAVVRDPGEGSVAGPTLSLDQAVLDVQAAGWTASIDDGRLHVHLQMPGCFRQLRVETRAAGVCLAVDLADWSLRSRVSERAMRRLALAANARIPLVRLAIDESARPRVLRAEVNMGSVPILGLWLTASIDVLATAVMLLARELAALRDPELAELVLAAA